MKLLVFAHTPPPLHGQSAMVATLVEGLRGDPEIQVVHVNVRLSRDGTDIGRWRPGKGVALLAACGEAWRARLRHGRCVFYYVPAPGKRGALWRDLVVMLLCRPWFSHLVLHWHAVGLGNWLQTRATAPERWLARRLLGRADLSLVLAPELAEDAAVLAPKRSVAIPNCVPDPGPAPSRPPTGVKLRAEILYLGLCSREKGVFDTVEAIAQAHSRSPGSVRLTVAGGFATDEEARTLHGRIAALPHDLVRYVGFAGDVQKRELYANADVFCFPTCYPHEGQPLSLIEALAHNLPIVTTRWRAIPGMLPRRHIWYVEPGHPEALAAALLEASQAAPADSSLREHYIAHFTPARHLAALKAALGSIGGQARSAQGKVEPTNPVES